MDFDFKIKGLPTTPRGQHQFRLKARHHYNESRVGQRPAEVPPLNLGKLGDWEEEDVWYVPKSERRPCAAPAPDSSSTLSWGRARSVRAHETAAKHFKKTPVDKKPPPWEEELVIPEDLPPPSERHRLQYQQYQAEMREGFRLQSQRGPRQPSHQPQQMVLSLPLSPPLSPRSVTPQDERAPLQQSHTPRHSQRKLEAEDLAVLRKKQAVVEQVMVDQLSRAVISDPDQNLAQAEPTRPAESGSVPLRFRRRTLHETQVRTRSALTENLLLNKLRFDARILSRNGRDASRELVGFFFSFDGALTVYEYRQFGRNRTNALPFIPKGCYKHQRGRRRGTQYSVHDFYVGANLSFSSHEKSLPDNMKQRPLLMLRVTDVDQPVKDMLLASAGEGDQSVQLKEEHEDRSVLTAIQGLLQGRLRQRAVRTLTGLGKLLRGADASGDGLLGKEEIRRALEEFHLTLPEQDLDAVWRTLDQDGIGRVDYREFVRGAIGEMNETRKSFVRKAFMKLDPSKTGSIPMTDIEKFYCAKGHPKVVSGQCAEEQLRAGFVQALQEAGLDPRELSYCEFEDYYEGLSIGIAHDQDFANILKNSWGI